MAVFSSRGPNGAAADIIKPDVTAPGVQILAGNSPNAVHRRARASCSRPSRARRCRARTSAGVGALLVGEHPDWSPAMVQSALTTTAHQDVDKEDGTTPGDPFDFGGGHIAPLPANDPGLVYDADFDDYLGFLCGAGELSPTAHCDDSAIDPSDLNLATIGIGELAGSQVVTREVTNVDDAAATYTPTVEAPAGRHRGRGPAVARARRRRDRDATPSRSRRRRPPRSTSGRSGRSPGPTGRALGAQPDRRQARGALARPTK